MGELTISLRKKKKRESVRESYSYLSEAREVIKKNHASKLVFVSSQTMS